MASASIDVYIKLPSGKAIESQHFPTDTVRKVAAVIADKEGVPEARVRLKYQGKMLDKTKTIGYLGVCAETILKGEIIFPKDITISVKFPDGHCDSMTMANTDTIQSLKHKIDAASGIGTNDQILKLSNGVAITGDISRLLCDVGVMEESVVEVKEKPTVTPTASGGVEEEELDENKKQELLGSFDTAGRNVEVVFCFDTTGSMYSCLDTVRQRLRSTCQRLLRDIPHMRIGIMALGDYCDYATYVVRYVDLTSDVDVLIKFAEDVPATEGGDAPEVRRKLRDTCSRLLRDIPHMRIGLMANGDYCDQGKYVVKYVDFTSDVDTLVNFANNAASTGGGGNGGEAYEWALRKAQVLDWSEDSAKAFVMIGDELPHTVAYTDQHVFWQTELDILIGMGVKVYGVQALTRAESKPFYEELAERSNGYYLQLQNFNLITDMFLAVCYRESNSEQLDAFVEEIEKEGRMTEETKQVLDKLEESKPTREETEQSRQNQRRYVAASWWDPSLENENAVPQYCYDQEKDYWGLNQANNRSASRPASVGTYRTPSPQKSKFKRFWSSVKSRFGRS